MRKPFSSHCPLVLWKSWFPWQEDAPGGPRSSDRCRGAGVQAAISSTFASLLSILPAAAHRCPGESRCAEEVLRTVAAASPGPPGGPTPIYPHQQSFPSTSTSRHCFQPAAARLPWETLWLGGSSGPICISLHIQQMEGVVIVWPFSGG